MMQKDAPFSFGNLGEDFKDATQRNLPRLELAPELLDPEHASGYNPYERDPGGKPRAFTGTTQRTDLRKLSEWIKLQKQVEAQKNAPVEETGAHPTLPQDLPKP